MPLENSRKTAFFTVQPSAAFTLQNTIYKNHLPTPFLFYKTAFIRLTSAMTNAKNGSPSAAAGGYVEFSSLPVIIHSGHIQFKLEE